MKKYFLLFFIASTVFATTIYPVQETFWQKLWRCNIHPSCYSLKLGTAVTSIAGSDTISSSRTVINTNFSNLNTHKIEDSDYYSTTTHSSITSLLNLTTVGTISVGTWGGTAIVVSKGGTGTTTPSSNQVILGDTTSGFKTVAGYGTSGQFLTSTGISSAPTWQSATVNQTLDYIWTGNHTFSTSTTYISNVGIVNATSSININGVELTRQRVLFTGSGSSATGATTTVASATIPAGSFGANETIRIYGSVYNQRSGNPTCGYDIAFGNGSATTTVATLSLNNLANDYLYGQMNVNIVATSTTNQLAQGFSPVSNEVSGADGNKLNNTIDTALTLISHAYTGVNIANQSYISFATKVQANSGTCFFNGITVELIQ